jgi:hypothetical protein
MANRYLDVGTVLYPRSRDLHLQGRKYINIVAESDDEEPLLYNIEQLGITMTYVDICNNYTNDSPTAPQRHYNSVDNRQILITSPEDDITIEKNSQYIFTNVPANRGPWKAVKVVIYGSGVLHTWVHGYITQNTLDSVIAKKKSARNIFYPPELELAVPYNA